MPVAEQEPTGFHPSRRTRLVIAFLSFGGLIGVGAFGENLRHHDALQSAKASRKAAEVVFKADLRALRADDKKLSEHVRPQSARFYDSGIARDAEGRPIPGVVSFGTNLDEVGRAERDGQRLTRAVHKLIAATDGEAGAAGVPDLAVDANVQAADQYSRAEQANDRALSAHRFDVPASSGTEPAGYFQGP